MKIIHCIIDIFKSISSQIYITDTTGSIWIKIILFIVSQTGKLKFTLSFHMKMVYLKERYILYSNSTMKMV